MTLAAWSGLEIVAPLSEGARNQVMRARRGEECVNHGDVGAGDILVAGQRVTLLDWDESRVDVPWSDFPVSGGYLPGTAPIASTTCRLTEVYSIVVPARTSGR